MSTIAIIPARGGSKRIPRKNIRLFAGKPMIAYSIEAARESGVFDRIVVSTDDDEIASVAKNYGAEVPFCRPAQLADEHASTEDVLVHALEALAEYGENFEHACCIYATVPFLAAEDLVAGLDALRQAHATTAFAVTTYEYPVFRALSLRQDGRLAMIWPEHRDARSQDLPEAWHDAGQFYWVNVLKFLTERQLFSCDSIPVKIPRWRVQDIDTPEDWRRAEVMFEALGRT
jgi:pseudaminic acid cytidylyltransferase